MDWKPRKSRFPFAFSPPFTNDLSLSFRHRARKEGDTPPDSQPTLDFAQIAYALFNRFFNRIQFMPLSAPGMIKTSCKGQKCQQSRKGHKFKLVFEGRRGAGVEITVETLAKAGFTDNKQPKIKILGNGELTKKFAVKVPCSARPLATASRLALLGLPTASLRRISANAKIEKADGSVA